LLAEAIVLIQHVWLDKLLYVLFHRCSLVEETSALTVLHGYFWITTAIDDSDNIPIGLGRDTAKMSCKPREGKDRGFLMQLEVKF
jgi:hypothetical protein